MILGIFTFKREFYKVIVYYIIYFAAPGPKYQLKTLVGYKDHCISRHRNPAYTFGGRHIILEMIESPGPKYMIEERRPKGFTFGYAAKRRGKKILFVRTISLLQFLFSCAWQILCLDLACISYRISLAVLSFQSNGELNWGKLVKRQDLTISNQLLMHQPFPCTFRFFWFLFVFKVIRPMNCFIVCRGLRTTVEKPVISAGPYSYSLNAVKPRAPTYTIASRRALQLISESPGPIYAVSPSKPTPAFSFGVKHSECAPPYITECDEQC